MLKYLTGNPECELLPMVSGDCRDVASLHALRFPLPWGQGEFASLLSQDSVFRSEERRVGKECRL